MKLSARDAEAFLAKPDADRSGLLIYGQDGMRVALKRQQVLKALLGPNAEEEMRLTRMPGAELRKDPAALLDAVKATGFFPGPRCVFVEETPDNAHVAVAQALEDWAPGDAFVLVTAGALKPASKLRKLFEGHRRAVVAAIYDNPPTRAEIERTLGEAGLRDIPADSAGALASLAQELSPGDFAKTVEKIALYKLGDASPLSLEDIEACAPRSTEAGTDTLIDMVASGQGGEVGPLVRRLQGQGINAVTICITAMRHFRMLYTAAADPGGPAAGVGRLRPPLYGPRRDKVVRQAQDWGPDKLQTALTLLTDTDLALRSAGQTAPAMAVMERALIRLAMLSRSR
ncbi:DNA polymerase III subunit delta [Marinibacterium profundimaris]|uniref:DNA-directed DNA polymerase n=1 Tax=Marinibacterium profundimaris TaxID=1679460 RepID=A0A225NIN7_9RHOB|nr:DNA polymerase III subunit delta [Marinibacterium profundimaris]OWU73594.1 DNA polymerase III subunit delta [Marinibacterium profundimaris]